MPTHILARVIWQVKNDDPKNQFVINPTFRHQLDPLSLTGPAWQTLADDLATAINGWQGSAVKHTKVALYDLEGAVPNYPKAIKVINPVAYWDLFAPPQMAVTLSFYGPQNIPRHRGRLYIQPGIAGILATDIAQQHVTSATRTKIGGLAPIFANLGGTNVDWIVWSRVANAATKVENWWVDDSWDVIRSRKLKGTTRLTGTTSG